MICVKNCMLINDMGKIGYVFKFSHYKLLEAMDPWGVVNLDFRGQIGRIYVGEH